ncbi:hypothetical protein E2C01_089728 [Portunus trituberculatus]|uniref:Uncharacterized protein n=1 Tax=Portunus trituberculatus TaxID=210409 RepID=A0A5B7JQD6_PORTR|nr:hypothetical protein [Portunus trituberculatus]
MYFVYSGQVCGECILVSNNERADTLAKQGAYLPLVTINIPRSLHQLQGKIRHSTVLQRRRQEQEPQAGDSISARWYAEVAAVRPCQTDQGESKRMKVVRPRIRLGYQYGWQLGIAATDEQKQCRLCRVRDRHTLQHYLRDCPRVCQQRDQCAVPSTLAQLAIHFLDILPDTKGPP